MKIAITLLISLTVIVTVSTICENGWTAFKEDCIYFSNSAKTWVEAEMYCRQHQGWLMTDDSEEKHNFIRDILYVLKNFKETKFFIGGSDVAFENQWRWIETGLNVRGAGNAFNAWGVDEPDGNNSKNCLAYKWQNSSLVWSDESCGSVSGSGHHTHHHGALYFICEKPNENPPGVSVIG